MTTQAVIGSVVYNGAKVYINKHFHKVVVHAIIIDQCNQSAGLYDMQVTAICGRAIISLRDKNAVLRGLSVKLGLGH